jgi:hypothetical protein
MGAELVSDLPVKFNKSIRLIVREDFVSFMCPESYRRYVMVNHLKCYKWVEPPK